MTQVLVVCKTQMKKSLCLGGIVAGTYEKIRLLTPQGDNQPENTEFNVGDIWECDLSRKPGTRKPHTEDMLVSPKHFQQRVPNMRAFLLQRLDLERSHQSTLFDGMLRYTNSGSAYISQRTGLPSYAHAFWLPLYGFELRKERKSKYYYADASDSSIRLRLPYVGLDDPVQQLPPGSLLHLSLARWWRRPSTREERCYLQLSGFFI